MLFPNFLFDFVPRKITLKKYSPPTLGNALLVFERADVLMVVQRDNNDFRIRETAFERHRGKRSLSLLLLFFLSSAAERGTHIVKLYALKMQINEIND